MSFYTTVQTGRSWLQWPHKALGSAMLIGLQFNRELYMAKALLRDALHPLKLFLKVLQLCCMLPASTPQRCNLTIWVPFVTKSQKKKKKNQPLRWCRLSHRLKEHPLSAVLQSVTAHVYKTQLFQGNQETCWYSCRRYQYCQLQHENDHEYALGYWQAMRRVWHREVPGSDSGRGPVEIWRK